MNRTIGEIRRSKTYLNYIEALRSNIENSKRRMSYDNENKPSSEERFNVSELRSYESRIPKY